MGETERVDRLQRDLENKTAGTLRMDGIRGGEKVAVGLLGEANRSG